jgi:cation transport ATPase
VLEGTADVDESLVTVESQAISKAPSAAVLGGTLAVALPLRLERHVVTGTDDGPACGLS